VPATTTAPMRGEHADCIAAQTARSKAEPLATSDPHLLDLCHAEGIATVVLPGSDGPDGSRPVERTRPASARTHGDRRV